MAITRRRRPAAPVVQATISETELSTILNDREALKMLKKQVSDMEKSLERREVEVMDKLRKSVPVEGGYMAAIEKKLGQCRPAWKDAFRSIVEKFGLNPDVEEKRVQDETAIPEKEVLVIAPVIKSC